MKKDKGQLAMEYLMTYGWAILIILIALGALFYLGILKPVSTNICTDAPEKEDPRCVCLERGIIMREMENKRMIGYTEYPLNLTFFSPINMTILDSYGNKREITVEWVKACIKAKLKESE